MLEDYYSMMCVCVLVKRCDETRIVNKCGINTFLYGIIHVNSVKVESCYTYIIVIIILLLYLYHTCMLSFIYIH